MDLKTGNLLWPALTPRYEAYPPLDRSVQCDFVVVGAGVSGAMAAWHLAQAGADVVVVDRRPPVTGSTPASTALLQYEIDVPLVELREAVGQKHANRAYRRCDRALSDLWDLCGIIDDSSDVAKRNSLFLAGEEEDLSFLSRETAARRDIGLDVTLLHKSDLLAGYGIAREGAILSGHALELDPYRLTLSLLRAAEQQGARIFGQTEIDLTANNATRVELSDAHGRHIRARHAVFATGYETPEQFNLQKLCKLKSTYAIATAPLDPSSLWPNRSLIWEHADPYFYCRTTADGRIVAGGEDEEIVNAEKRDALIEQKSETLTRKLQLLFPNLLIEPQHRWAGTFAGTEDGLPYIGQASHLPGCSFALGYGGNGITFSLIAAQIICAALTGKPDPDAELFSFDRTSHKKK